MKVWDVATGKLKHDLVGHSRVEAADFSPDGTYFVTCYDEVAGVLRSKDMSSDKEEQMTARFAEIPLSIARRMADDILQLGGLDAVLYDVTHKPPGTIEWE